MNPVSLGIDTSCYTTSIAIVDSCGKVLLDERTPLSVRDGQKGLRQSDAFYQHVMNLPSLFERASIYSKSIASVTASTRPRNIEGSYMPVFNAGASFAKVISDSLSVPFYNCSHQEGHIHALLQEAGLADAKNFAVVHLSGGTAEVLRASLENSRIETSLLGGSLDITAGQLIDRLGLKLGFSFPAGRALDEIAVGSTTDEYYPTSVKNGYFNLSGIENLIDRDLRGNKDSVEVIGKTFNCISSTLQKAFIQLGLSEKAILLTGGVSASSFLRNKLSDEFANIHFGPAGLCTDNAVGVARMGTKLSGAEVK